MQYVQRKLQRSVTEIRRSRKTRPRVSASGGVFAGRLWAVAMVCDVVMRLSDSAGCAPLGHEADHDVPLRITKTRWVPGRAGAAVSEEPWAGVDPCGTGRVRSSKGTDMSKVFGFAAYSGTGK